MLHPPFWNNFPTYLRRTFSPTRAFPGEVLSVCVWKEGLRNELLPHSETQTEHTGSTSFPGKDSGLQGNLVGPLRSHDLACKLFPSFCIFKEL